MNKIDTDRLIAFLRAIKEHSYESIGGNGESIHGFDDTTVSFDSSGHFLCYTTVIEGVLYSFYNDLVLQKDDENGFSLAEYPRDFDLINAKLESEYKELEFGPSFE